MIQAIQVLRFHLLELEKVMFSRRFCTVGHYKHYKPMGCICRNVFCKSVVISVNINHGAISLPRLITTQAVTTSAYLAGQISPHVLMKFNVGRNCTQGETYWRTFRNDSSWRAKGPRQPSVESWNSGCKTQIRLRIRRTTVAWYVMFNQVVNHR